MSEDQYLAGSHEGVLDTGLPCGWCAEGIAGWILFQARLHYILGSELKLTSSFHNKKMLNGYFPFYWVVNDRKK
jgi:hypothetical protein